MSEGDRIRQLRQENNMTQRQFAEKILVSHTFVYQMEKGVKPITNRTLELICNRFNVNAVWIRTGEGEKYKTDPEESETDRIFQKIKNLDPAFQNYIFKQIDSLLELHDNVKHDDFDRFSIPTETVTDDINFLKQTLKQAEKKKES